MRKGVLYINQFFAGIGGEEKADFNPVLLSGTAGAGLLFNKYLNGAEITHTIVCGDNYIASNIEEAIDKILELIKDLKMDFFIAGPAFYAGRYGVACGAIGKVIGEKYNIPVFSSMHEENPGVNMFKKDLIIFKGGKSAASMKDDIKIMTNYINKKFNQTELYWAEKERYFGRGIRHQISPSNEIGQASKRAVDMLLKKINNENYISELIIPKVDRVPPAPPLTNLKESKIALVTSSGVVPSENPDRIQSASATRWGMYDISNFERLESKIFKTIHAGYDPSAADANPNVCVPLDALRAYEKEGIIGKVDTHFYTTVGTGTTEAEAKRMAEEMIVYLKDHNVDGVILTST